MNLVKRLNPFSTRTNNDSQIHSKNTTQSQEQISRVPHFVAEDTRIVDLNLQQVLNGFWNTIPSHPKIKNMVSRTLINEEIDNNGYKVYNLEVIHSNFVNRGIFDFGPHFLLEEQLIVQENKKGIQTITRHMINKNHKGLFEKKTTVEYIIHPTDPTKTICSTTMTVYGNNFAIRGIIKLLSGKLQTTFINTITETIDAYSSLF